MLTRHADEIEALRADYEDIGDRMQQWQQRAEDVHDAILHDMQDNAPSIGDYSELPQARVAEENLEALFDSRRSYPAQLFAYKRHKNGNGHNKVVEDLRLQALVMACQANDIENNPLDPKGDRLEQRSNRFGDDDHDD